MACDLSQIVVDRHKYWYWNISGWKAPTQIEIYNEVFLLKFEHLAVREISQLTEMVEEKNELPMVRY